MVFFFEEKTRKFRKELLAKPSPLQSFSLKGHLELSLNCGEYVAMINIYDNRLIALSPCLGTKGRRKGRNVIILWSARVRHC